MVRFRRFLSVDNPKAAKAAGYGYLNGINYGAPGSLAGVGNMCPHASAGCLSLCLGVHSGQAAIAKPGSLSRAVLSRIAKTQFFMRDRSGFMSEFAYHVERLADQARRLDLVPAVRPNGSTDIAFEGIPVVYNGNRFRNIMEAFPNVQFIDYTKNLNRLRRYLPSNYHLTFSLSETNESEAREALGMGFNVAAVFANELPKRYLGRPVVNGDLHDLRHLDPKGGVIVGLSPKGRKAKADQSGFVIRDYQEFND